MNLRQKAKSNFRALEGQKRRQILPEKPNVGDFKLDMNAFIPLTRSNLDTAVRSVSPHTNINRRLNALQTDAEGTHVHENVSLASCDEKIKMTCKVHILKSDCAKSKELRTDQTESDDKLRMTCKVHVLKSDCTEGGALCTDQAVDNVVSHHSKRQRRKELIKLDERTAEVENLSKTVGSSKKQLSNVDSKETTSKCVVLLSKTRDSVTGASKNRTVEVPVVQNKELALSTSNVMKSDPKLKQPCKVHVVRLTLDKNRQLCSSKQPIRTSKPDSNVIYKVVLRQNSRSTKNKSKKLPKSNGMSKYVNQSIEIENLSKEIEWPSAKQLLDAKSNKIAPNGVQGAVTSDIVAARSDGQVRQSAKDKQMNFDSSCHADCDHSFATVCKTVRFNSERVDIINNSKLDKNEETKSKQGVNMPGTRKKNVTQKVALKDQNGIIPLKRTVKKKAVPSVPSENIPENHVEKCTGRIPVYTTLDENVRNSLNRKSNPYDFNEIDLESGNAKKPPKKRRKAVKPKNQKNKTTTYDKCLKQIMNKLAITLQSNKFVTKVTEKSPKNKVVLPRKSIRIQTKRPKVKFKDELVTKEVVINDKAKTHNKSKAPINKINGKLANMEVRDENLGKMFNKNSEFKNKTENSKLGEARDIAEKVLDNKASHEHGKERKYVTHKHMLRTMNPRKLFGELNQVTSTTQGDRSNDNDNDSSKTAGIISSEKNSHENVLDRNETTENIVQNKDVLSRPISACSSNGENMFASYNYHNDPAVAARQKLPLANVKNSKPCLFSSDKQNAAETDDSLDNEDLDMSFASQISFHRPNSACSGETNEDHGEEHIAEDDPYFGFGGDEDDEAHPLQPPSCVITNKPNIQRPKKILPAIGATQKSDSPWRYSPRNISFNPHFVRLKANALPVINQEPVLDCTFDENIKKHHPNLISVDQAETSRTKSPIQKTMLDYITSSVQANKENAQRLSLFNDDEFSPIKTTYQSPPKLDRNKAKRNVLGALSNNIIVHSVIAVSTPQRDKSIGRVESPNFSVIFHDLKDDRSSVKVTTVWTQNLQKGDAILIPSINQEEGFVEPLSEGADNIETNLEIVDADNIETNVEIVDDFNGFSVSHVETSKTVSNKLDKLVQEHEQILDEQQKQIQISQTLFGFETTIEDKNADNNEKGKIKNRQRTNDDAKPFRLFLGGKKTTQKKLNAHEDQDDEVRHVKRTPEKSTDTSDSESEFIPPTPIPDDEPLKYGIFEEVEGKKSSKTYRCRKRYREMRADDSEDEEDTDKNKKKKKDQPTKEEVEKFDKWAAQFNAMCEEVDKFPLEIE